MIEFIKQHAWIVLWLWLTPFMLIIGMWYYITNAFNNITLSLKDWNDIDKDYFE